LDEAAEFHRFHLLFRNDDFTDWIIFEKGVNGGVKAIGAEAVILLELHFGLHNDASLFVLRFRSTSSKPAKLSTLTMFKLTLSARMRASGDGLDVAATLPRASSLMPSAGRLRRRSGCIRRI
jgi:hypothetical protein